jgi:hypothetical protein
MGMEIYDKFFLRKSAMIAGDFNAKIINSLRLSVFALKSPVSVAKISLGL